MSALFGIFRFDGEAVRVSDLHDMNAALAMHGPDSDGIWTEGRVGLGHRLMRFTPEDHFERQPVVAARNRLSLISDGRIDNRPELMSELSIARVDAEKMPDSEFILRAYEKWGAECPRHLVGAFAFAVYNVHENSLLLARSPRGERSLFYHVSAREFAFSTAPKGLFALRSVPRQVNRDRVADLLVAKPPDPTTSFFAGVQRLPQGNSILVRPEGLKRVQYWRIDPGRQVRFSRDEDYVDAFDSIFGRAIGDHLRSITPVGIMMSGGIDSTSIAAIAAEKLAGEGGRLAAFTEVPQPGTHTVARGRYSDETPYVAAMAGQYRNIDLHLVRTDGRFFLDGIERFFSAAEFPFRNASNLPWWSGIHEEAAACGARVLLTGCIGNFTISWAGLGVLPGLIKGGNLRGAFWEARALTKSGASPSIFQALARGVMPFVPPAVWLAGQHLRRRNYQALKRAPQWRSYSAIRPEFAARHRVAERAKEIGYSFDPRPAADYRLAVLPGRDVAGDIPRGHEAMFGVQTRDPANDQRVIEFCFAIPESQYLRNGTTRWLIRRSMANRLPPEILSNRRRGMQAADWLDRFVAFQHRVLEELDLQEACALASEALDLRRIRLLVQDLPKIAQSRQGDHHQLRMLLDIGIMTGRFLRWLETGI